MTSRRRFAAGVAALALVGAVLMWAPSPAAAAPALGTDAAGGYVYLDDRAPGGPTFTIRNAPTVLTFVGGTDDGEANVALPFAFDFYGNSYATVTVSPNGAVVFPAGQAVSFVNADLATVSQTMIAPLWYDWVVSGQVSTGVSGVAPTRVFTIHWDDVRPFGGSAADAVDFQLQLFEQGDVIEFHYLEVESSATLDLGLGATIGIDNGATSRLQYSFNEASLVNGRAIRFSPVFCEGQTPTLTGTFGPDALVGTAGDDVIVTLSGNDTVATGPGNDRVCSGSGDDVVNLGGGGDRALGGNGLDRMNGQGGADFLNGGTGPDVLQGGGGPDICVGGPGIDFGSGCESRTSIP